MTTDFTDDTDESSVLVFTVRSTNGSSLNVPIDDSISFDLPIDLFQNEDEP